MAVISSVSYVVFVLYFTLPVINGHGMMIEPAMRSSLWRFDYPDAVPNYNDNGLNCGGFTNQHEKQHGRCGVCGDPYQGPRDNEFGGKYAKGIIAKTYKAGQYITVVSDITANHGGFIEVRLCPHNNARAPVSQRCLNQNLLQIKGHGTRYLLTSSKKRNFRIRHTVKLPDYITCRQCVLQWFWKAGQHNGINPVTNKECIGCGRQEEFINCADIAITDEFGQFPTPAPQFQATTPMPMYDQFLFQQNGMYPDYFDEFSPFYGDPSFLNPFNSPFLNSEFASLNQQFGNNEMQNPSMHTNNGMQNRGMKTNIGMQNRGMKTNIGMQNPSMHANKGMLQYTGLPSNKRIQNQGMHSNNHMQNPSMLANNKMQNPSMFVNNRMQNSGMIANNGIQTQNIYANNGMQPTGMHNIYLKDPLRGLPQQTPQNVGPRAMVPTTAVTRSRPYTQTRYQTINTRPTVANSNRRPLIPRNRRPFVPRTNSPQVKLNTNKQMRPALADNQRVPPQPSSSISYSTRAPTIGPQVVQRKLITQQEPNFGDSDVAEAFEDLMDNEGEFLKNMDFWNDFNKLLNMSSPETKQALYEIADDAENLQEFHRNVRLMMQMMGDGVDPKTAVELGIDSDDSLDINWLLKEAKEQGLDSDELSLLEDAKDKRDSGESDNNEENEESSTQEKQKMQYYGNNDENRLLDDSGIESDDSAQSDGKNDKFDYSDRESFEKEYNSLSSEEDHSEMANNDLNKDYDSDEDSYQHNEIKLNVKTSSSSLNWGYNQPTPTPSSVRTNPWNENSLYRSNVDYDDKDVNVEGDSVNAFKKIVPGFTEKTPSYNYMEIQNNKLQVNTFGSDTNDYSESENEKENEGDDVGDGEENKKWNKFSEEKEDKQQNEHWSAGAVPDIYAGTVIVTSRKRGSRIDNTGKEKENENEIENEDKISSKNSKLLGVKKGKKVSSWGGQEGNSAEKAENEVVEKSPDAENEKPEKGSLDKQNEDENSNNLIGLTTIYQEEGDGKSANEENELKQSVKENSKKSLKEENEMKTLKEENEIKSHKEENEMKSPEEEIKIKTPKEENSFGEMKVDLAGHIGDSNIVKPEEDIGESKSNSVFMNNQQFRNVDDPSEPVKSASNSMGVKPFIGDSPKFMGNMKQAQMFYPTAFPAMNSFTTRGSPFMMIDNRYSTQYQQTPNQQHTTMSGFRKRVQNRISKSMGHNIDDPVITQPLTLKVKIKSTRKSKKGLSPNLSKLVLKMFMNSKSGAPPCDGNLKSVCRPVKMWSKYQQVADWCTSLCPYGQCPSAVCKCQCTGSPMGSVGQKKCRATNTYKQNSGELDQWCQKTCSKGDCPALLCVCS